jgi:hypothetical protein
LRNQQNAKLFRKPFAVGAAAAALSSSCCSVSMAATTCSSCDSGWDGGVMSGRGVHTHYQQALAYLDGGSGSNPPTRRLQQLKGVPVARFIVVSLNADVLGNASGERDVGIVFLSTGAVIVAR